MRLDVKEELDKREEEIREIINASDDLLHMLEGGDGRITDFIGFSLEKDSAYRKREEAFYRILEKVEESANIYDSETGCSIEDCLRRHNVDYGNLAMLIGSLLSVYDEKVQKAANKLRKMLVDIGIIQCGLREATL